jgi:aryl-alcohol dehydrogenase-like predicted oxidoreductase
MRPEPTYAQFRNTEHPKWKRAIWGHPGFGSPWSGAIVERLEDFCARRGHSLLELAFSWLASRPYVASVIAGATKPEQLEQNVKAVSWTLTSEDLAEVDRITGTA